MTTPSRLNLLPVASTPCGCCAPTGATAMVTAPTAEPASTAEFGVTGMTCSHCVVSVTEAVAALDGVVDARVDLVVGGTSRLRVRSDRPMSEGTVGAAVVEVGYTLEPLS
ncbi:heavy-metal-associated domain-containing protein (plasmid) [Clavibacter phaseoli]|uniref:Heavy-metal-associated domain-containing protein n=1 Tax=Clavibacter phaseoli TaxID=1734031 RepID=A0A8I0SFN7_9MICO|nr:heavy-metal-associated domain-containing protein [Clavibacter phaseoli]UKF32414.1 heavy-metal-associated domain-containing protein [Clavibacter phaseoli]UKF38468.1 heavy-metal-associated domain-containing protein [Clavibacter phaseoli]